MMQYIHLNRAGCVAQVDEIDYDWLMAMQDWPYGYWRIGNRGYAVIWQFDANGKRRVLSMHRLIAARAFADDLFAGYQVDHINRNRLDNRRQNLRLATPQQNLANRQRRSDSTNPYKGICVTTSQRWTAAIGVAGETIALGVYDTPEEAAAMYVIAQRHFFGDFAMDLPEGVVITPAMEGRFQRILHRRNQPKPPAVRHSAYRGLMWDRTAWRVSLQVNNQRIELGRFDDEEEAARAYDEAVRGLGLSRPLNFADGG